MGKYSIKELERLSGIRAHTIRIWEKRHQLIHPQRTKTNIRFYSDEDLKKIINVSVLNNHGVKISKIANLSVPEINRQVAELSQTKDDTEIFIEQLIVSMIDLDEEGFNKILGNLVLKLGLERTMLEIVYPFLEKIGVLWLTNKITPAQEHFISNLIRQKLIVAIDNLPMPSRDSKKAVLFLPENELHEIALLFYFFICKKEGVYVYYLGQTVPYASLKSVCEEHHPNIIISSFTSQPSSYAIQNYVNKMAEDFATTKIFLSGYAFAKTQVDPPSNVTLFDKALILKDLLK